MNSNHLNQFNSLSADSQGVFRNYVVQAPVMPINCPIIYSIPNVSSVPIIQSVPVIQSQSIITPPSSQFVLQSSVSPEFSQNLQQNSQNLPQSSPNLPQSSQNLPQSSQNLPQYGQYQASNNETDSDISIDTDSDDEYCNNCEISKVRYLSKSYLWLKMTFKNR